MIRALEQLLALGASMQFDRLALRANEHGDYIIVTKTIAGFDDVEVFGNVQDAVLEFLRAAQHVAVRKESL